MPRSERTGTRTRSRQVQASVELATA